jgi:predicted MPP superfamily phosphohydrolase
VARGAVETAARQAQRQRRRRVAGFVAFLVTAMALLFGAPLWTVVLAPAWPALATLAGCLAALAGAAALPYLMYQGHGRGSDVAARIADVLLGAVWVLFTCSAIGAVVGLVLRLGGAAWPMTGRVVAAAVVVVAAAALLWGHHEAMRVPRVRTVEVGIAGLGTGLDGLRVVLITDTHYGPIDRADWSARVVGVINELEPDIACHTGDIADGPVRARRAQSGHLRDVRARLARAYVTGNHEYFGEPDGWLQHMTELGWESLHNRHLVIERGGSRLVLAGVDDRTARGSGRPGHGADHAAALSGAPEGVPVLLLAHQPKQIAAAVEHGVDLQLSGHTHGGQIWPFHALVRVDQPVVQGLSRHGDRTQLYTSRGTGFWGPPFRVFAPSEITLIVLRSA